VEKRKPHHELRAFKALFSKADALVVTITALADHTCWQDVYHVPSEGIVLYVKFTDDRITVFRLLSFKRK